MAVGYCFLKMRAEKHVITAAWSSEYKMALLVLSKKSDGGGRLHFL